MSLINYTMIRKDNKIILFVFLTISLFNYSQTCNQLGIQHQADIPSVCSTMVMTMIHDVQNRPYLYVANKEGGLTIYDISTISTPSLIASVLTKQIDTLDVMHLTQKGNYIYLATGNHFSNNQYSGMAIIDVTNPTTPIVTDSWKHTNKGGTGVIKVEGNYAYLGAMTNGLLILDVSNPSNISFVSQFIPTIHYPVSSPNPGLYNARGMEVKNDIVYLCYDAGGLRVINCVNKFSPKETGRFCNPALYVPLNLPRAYNNIVLKDTLAYLAVDYCGMEVISIADTSQMKLVGWWNPYNCPTNNWFTSPVHANEIALDTTLNLTYLSTGKSDLLIIDVTNPSQPDSCNFYGGSLNSIGTWGVSIHQNKIFLSYICTLGIPFSSNWTGIKILTYNSTNTSLLKNFTEYFSIYPNPSADFITIEQKTKSKNRPTIIKITNMLGKVVMEKIISGERETIDTRNWTQGLYNATINEYSTRIIIE
ncbi:MAG: T9SS type A sorting domain-containing protein [Bacteroidetes bacterium]|nr:T9SS type A sorting domain-containing protein [Bacteroidota bacterium]